MPKEPMRVIQGTTKPHEPFWRFRNEGESQSGEVELEFFGPISEFSWWGDEITPAAFKDELNKKGAGKPVTILVNSPGGEVVAASVIRTILQEYTGTVTADIVGLAASAATVVITGADHIRMRESALFMIHDPSGIVFGTIEEIKAFLDVLKTVKDSIVDTYETKTGMDREKLGKLMTEETWLTAREAKELGFIDEVVSSSTKKPNDLNVPVGFLNCLSSYSHVPESLIQQMNAPVQDQNTQDEPPEEERRLRNLVKLLK